jgi:hypothetical protein
MLSLGENISEDPSQEKSIPQRLKEANIRVIVKDN